MRQGQSLSLSELQAEVRAILAARRLRQEDAARLAGETEGEPVSRTYFNRALTATEHNPALLAVLRRFLEREAGYTFEPEITYRVSRVEGREG